MSEENVVRIPIWNKAWNKHLKAAGDVSVATLSKLGTWTAQGAKACLSAFSGAPESDPKNTGEEDDVIEPEYIPPPPKGT